MNPEIRDCPERVTAMRRQVIHPHDIGMTIGLGAEQLRDELIAAGAEIVSAPYARYHSFTKDATDIEVGFVVTSAVTVDGVQIGSLSAGREAVATHIGSYKDIPSTFAALEAWVAQHAAQRDVPREVYLTNSDATPMGERRTEIVLPIA